MGYTLNNLNDVKIKSLKPGMHCDGGGLWLRVSSPTAKSWCFRYMLDGRAREMGLGKARDISLKEARAMAAEARNLKAHGKDPLAEREAVRTAQSTDAAKKITFEECAKAYIEAHRAGWKNQKHAAQWASTIATYAEPIIGSLPVQDIDTALVLKVLQQKNKKFRDKNLWNARPETADRLRNRIENVLSWATAREYRKGENPARWRGHLEKLLPPRDKIQKVKHHPAMPYAEISSFMATLRENEDTASRALEFTILTASRTSEVLNAKFDEFSLKDSVWIIPAERMKAGKEHRVALSARAVEILESQPKGNVDNFVFRSPRGGALSNMAMLMLLRRMGLGEVVVHGFRSSFRDWAGETTAHPREVIEHALAHQLKDAAEAAYARGDLFTKRRLLMDDWAAACYARAS